MAAAVCPITSAPHEPPRSTSLAPNPRATTTTVPAMAMYATPV